MCIQKQVPVQLLMKYYCLDCGHRFIYPNKLEIEEWSPKPSTCFDICPRCSSVSFEPSKWHLYSEIK